MRPTLSSRLRLYAKDALAVTRAQSWPNAVIRAVVAVIVAGVVSYFLGEHWLSKAGIAILSGVGSVGLLYALTFVWNFFKAPPRVRQIYARPALGSNVVAQMFFDAKVRLIDAMQGDALTLADRIGKGSPRQEIRDMIERFGERARNDTLITRKSRRRSLALYAEISALEDLEAIRRKCLEFHSLKASR